jgi:hypothetical protein
MAEWWFKGELIETCNCAPFACPCNYTATPTHGNCRSVTAYRIDEGTFGQTRLDGLAFGMLYSWPGPIHDGNGRAVVYVDERANDAQREAIGRIGGGQAGEGGPFSIFATTYAEPATVVSGPIEIEREGKRARIQLGDKAQAELEPFRSAMDDSEANVLWKLPEGFIWREGEVVRTVRGEADADGVAFNYEDSWGVIAPVAYNV